MNRCKDCNYFKPKQHPQGGEEDFQTHDLKDFGGCSNPIFYHLQHDSFDKKKAVERRVKGRLFLYQDSENFRNSAYFHVHEYFGCIGFEERKLK